MTRTWSPSRTATSRTSSSRIAGESNVFDTSESVPDGDGLYRIGGSIITAETARRRRVRRFSPVSPSRRSGPGITTLSLTPSPTDVADRSVAATLTKVDATQIGDSDGDSYFDGPILDAEVAVDQAVRRRQADNPTVISTGGDDGGIPTWVILAAAAGIISVGAGGVALFVLRRSNPRAS